MTTLTMNTDHADGQSDEQYSGLSRDDLFHLLKSERRRRAIRYILDHEEIDGSEEIRMRPLAEWVAAQEYDKTVAALHSDERQRVYITLYQSHLPQLEKYGVIDYDQSRGIIEARPALRELDSYIESPVGFWPDLDPFWRGFVAGVAVMMVALLTLHTLMVLP